MTDSYHNGNTEASDLVSHSEEILTLKKIATLLSLLRINDSGIDEIDKLFILLSSQNDYLSHEWYLQERTAIGKFENSLIVDFFRILHEAVIHYPDSGYTSLISLFEAFQLRDKLDLPLEISSTKSLLRENHQDSEEISTRIEKFQSERSIKWIENMKILSTNSYSFLDDYDVLTYEQCKQLAITINEDENESTSSPDTILGRSPAFSKFVLHNLRLVRKISLSFASAYPYVEIEDLFQMGVTGLIRAVEKWDWTLEYQFSTYAVWWIKQSIHRLASDSDQLIRIPIHARDNYSARLQDMRKQFGLEDEINSLKDVSFHEFKNNDWKSFYQFHNSFIGHDSLTPIRYSSGEIRVPFDSPFLPRVEVVSMEEEIEASCLQQDIQNLLETLPEREAGVIIFRFGLVGEPKTLDEIGKIFGVTRERIRQIEKQTMNILREPSYSQHLRSWIINPF